MFLKRFQVIPSVSEVKLKILALKRFGKFQVISGDFSCYEKQQMLLYEQELIIDLLKRSCFNYCDAFLEGII